MRNGEKTRALPVKRPLMTRKRRQALHGIAYIMPACIIITMFCIVTIFMAIYYSFTEYNMINPPEFVALKNYTKLLSDKAFRSALVNTVKYVVKIGRAHV